MFDLRDWPKARIARFCQAWDDGVDAPALAERFGLTPAGAAHLVWKFRREGKVGRRGVAVSMTGKRRGRPRLVKLHEAAARFLEAIASGVCVCGKLLREATQAGLCYVCACGQRYQGRKPK